MPVGNATPAASGCLPAEDVIILRTFKNTVEQLYCPAVSAVERHIVFVQPSLWLAGDKQQVFALAGSAAAYCRLHCGKVKKLLCAISPQRSILRIQRTNFFQVGQHHVHILTARGQPSQRGGILFSMASRMAPFCGLRFELVDDKGGGGIAAHHTGKSSPLPTITCSPSIYSNVSFIF